MSHFLGMASPVLESSILCKVFCLLLRSDAGILVLGQLIIGEDGLIGIRRIVVIDYGRNNLTLGIAGHINALTGLDVLRIGFLSLRDLWSGEIEEEAHKLSFDNDIHTTLRDGFNLDKCFHLAIDLRLLFKIV